MGTGSVIVLGGTGFLGRRVVRRLSARGRSVTAGVRHISEETTSIGGRDPAIRHCRVDVRDSATVARGLEGADAVINCVGLYVETRESAFRDVHLEGARKVAEIAKAQKVRSLIHVSGIGVGGGSASAYIRARTEGEDAVRRAFPEATILRPSAMFSRDGAFFGVLEAIVRHLPIIPMFGDGSTRLQPVYVSDVAEAVCRIIDDPFSIGTVFELGGPEIFTYRDILRRITARTGRRRLFLPVPFTLWWAIARAASVLPHPPITPAQVALMQRDNVVGDGVATFSELSIKPRSASAMGLI
jgi:NADH dehydrogenase